MSVHFLLYVSRSLLRLPQELGEVDRIVAVARRENARLAVTGALVFTRAHFAQVLEGDEQAVEALMERIRKDRRHGQVTVVSQGERDARLFPQWSMAYSGGSLYVDRHIKPLLAAAPEPGATGPLAGKLVRLMREFAAQEVATAP
jgi:Sensors of blue-light using FAD